MTDTAIYRVITASADHADFALIARAMPAQQPAGTGIAAPL